MSKNRDSFSIALPQLDERGRCAPLRKSKRGKWRAAVLISVYILAGIHLLHWYLSGWTISPVEPSESMETLSQGRVNYGFIFFAAALLSTLTFGRFFCGWGCHIVAAQDLCTWILGRVGLRPKPFRSRLLLYVPLAAALYMFAWPLAERWLFDQNAPPWVSHLMSDDIWRTFPGVLMSIMSYLVCGFIVIYILGNKGFCTYGCPYGGFFAPLDKLALGKIRVTDACEGCGHCTATCTSNVRVHEEVKQFGMVVDPGCMKCLDCVDVCPKKALYFGFGMPSVARGKPRVAVRQRDFDFSWPEEVAMLVLFITVLYAVRGLYLFETVPFLLSIGIAGVCTYPLLLAARMLYQRGVRLHSWKLRVNGSVTPVGWVYAALSLALVAFFAHSLVVQYHTREGYRLARIVDRDAAFAVVAETSVDDAVSRGLAHLQRAESLALVASPRIELRIADLYRAHSAHRDLAQARLHAQHALDLGALRIDSPRTTLAQIALDEGNAAAALAVLQEEVQQNPDARDAAQLLRETAVNLEKFDEPIAALRDAVTHRPRNAEARMELGTLLVNSGQHEQGLAELDRALQDAPSSLTARMRLAFAYDALGRPDDAQHTMQEAVRRNPHTLQPRIALGDMLAAASRIGDAVTAYRGALEIAPGNVQTRVKLAALLSHAARYDEALAELQLPLRLQPPPIEACTMATRIAAERGDFFGALRYIDMARAQAPLNPYILIIWAQVLGPAGKFEATRAEWMQKHASATTPNDEVDYQLVFLHLKTGDEAAARSVFDALTKRGGTWIWPPDLPPPNADEH